MKYIVRQNLVSVLVILGMITLSSLVTAGYDPIIQDIDYTPKNPTALSTITFTATVTGDNPTVYVFVEECRDDLCYADVFNVTMEKTGTTQYEREITLKHADANIIHYQIIVEDQGMWYKSSLEEASLEDGETDNGNGTPGFEGILMIVSVVVMGLIILLKKRS
jgi:hypothetical protein